MGKLKLNSEEHELLDTSEAGELISMSGELKASLPTR